MDQALAYILEVLPAFTYLHDLGLVYCDFKPDNLIQIGDGVKLIDLGGVRRLDDDESAIYGTVGYQAPEVAQVGTSVASDIYTIGRTLLVCMMEFRGYQTRYVASLPSVDETPLFAEHDSLYRLISKACAPDPADRFASVDELRVQLLGVLREVVAAKTTRHGADLGGLGALRGPGDQQRRAHLGRAAGAAAGHQRRPVRLAEQRVGRRPARSPDGAGRGAGGDPGGRAGPSPGRAGARRPRPGRAGGQGDAGRRSVGVAGGLGEWPGGDAGSELPRRRSRPSMPSTGRCPASWRPSWLSGWPANWAARPTSPSGSTRPARAPTPTTWPRPPSAWPGSAPRGATSRAAVAALDLVPPTSRSFTEARRLRALHLYESADSLPVLVPGDEQHRRRTA